MGKAGLADLFVDPAHTEGHVDRYDGRLMPFDQQYGQAVRQLVLNDSIGQAGRTGSTQARQTEHDRHTHTWTSVTLAPSVAPASLYSSSLYSFEYLHQFFRSFNEPIRLTGGHPFPITHSVAHRTHRNAGIVSAVDVVCAVSDQHRPLWHGV